LTFTDFKIHIYRTVSSVFEAVVLFCLHAE